MNNFENRFLGPEDFNEAIHFDRLHYNCLAFAFGVTDFEFMEFMLNARSYPDVRDAFTDKASFFRIGVEQVEKLEEINGYGFILFGWVNGFSNAFGRRGFHVARIEPDGKIVHKLGVKELAGYTTVSQLVRMYRTEPTYFFRYTGDVDPKI